MKTNMLHQTILSLGLSAFVSLAFAQQNDSLLKDNKIEVIKNFKPVLSDAIKIPVNPNPEKPTFVKPVFNYEIPEYQYSVQPTIYTIKPLSVGTMLLPKLKGNYMKLGYGNYQMPMAEFYLSTVRNKQYQAGVFAKHLSAGGDDDYNKFSNNTVYAYAKKFLPKGVVGIDAYYHRNAVNYYGNPKELIKLLAEPKAVYHLYDLKANYQNYSKDSNGLMYKLDFGYYNFNNSGGFDENDASIKAKISKLNTEIPFELQTGLRLNNNHLKPVNGDWMNYQRIFFDLNPQVFLKGAEYYLQGGFNSTISSDSAGAKFHFYPKAEAGYTLIANKLKAYAGLTGRLEPNTYRSILSNNPFINELTLRNTGNNIEIYGGFTGEIGPQTNFSVSSSSLSIENLACYSQDSALGSQILLYDAGVSKASKLNLAIQHQYNEKFRLGFQTTIFGYKLKNLAHAYTLPLFEAKLNTTYNIGDKFLIKADVFYWGERYGRLDAKRADGTFASQDFKINPFVDLSIGIDYRYSKNLSAFLNFNNIANNKYQRFYSYPVYGLNILGGFTFTF